MGDKSRKQQIEQMLADDPGDPFLRYGLAMEYVAEGNDQKAVSCFQELLRQNPEYVPAYMHAGKALVRLGRDEDARAVWQQGVTAALQQGDQHAAEEMQGMVATLGEPS
jgi:Flp pilus assembly protein TadD